MFQPFDVFKSILAHDEIKLVGHAEDVFTAKLYAGREFREVGGEVSVRKIDAVIIEIDADNLCGTALSKTDGECTVTTAQVQNAHARHVELKVHPLEPFEVVFSLVLEIRLTLPLLVVCRRLARKRRDLPGLHLFVSEESSKHS